MTQIFGGLSRMKRKLEQQGNVWLQRKNNRTFWPGRRVGFLTDPNTATSIQEHTSNIVLSFCNGLKTVFLYICIYLYFNYKTNTVNIVISWRSCSKWGMNTPSNQSLICNYNDWSLTWGIRHAPDATTHKTDSSFLFHCPSATTCTHFYSSYMYIYIYIHHHQSGDICFSRS